MDFWFSAIIDDCHWFIVLKSTALFSLMSSLDTQVTLDSVVENWQSSSANCTKIMEKED
jgi:hypothetical protein